MTLLCLTKYTELGPSSRYRIFQYLAYLRSQDIDVQVQALLPASYLQARFAGKKLAPWHLLRSFAERLLALLRSRPEQLIWLEYELFPYLPAWFERLLVLSGRRYIVDYDDALFHQYDQHANWLVRRLLGRKIAAVMKR